MPPADPTLTAVPPLQPEEAAQRDRLLETIRHELTLAGGRLDFERYMELALYAPGLGYYSGGRRKFGARGDFVTAPELSPLFSRCLGGQCGEVLRQLPDADILEFGAGSGSMAAQILLTLREQGQLPGRYWILELSGELQQRQRQTLAATVPDLLPRVGWLQQLPVGFRGVILANEVLDAMPVQRFRITADGPRWQDVTWGDHGLTWVDGAAVPEPWRQRLDPLPAGYVSEVGRRGEAWVASLADCLHAGLVLLIDYGYGRAEYYHPDRRHGTLRCYYRHRAHDNPFLLPGLQDISAHVDFTAIAEAATGAGLELMGYSHQAGFLIGAGIDRHAADLPAATLQQQAELARQIRILTLPGEMGEAFKVMGLSRGLSDQITGFNPVDLRHRL